MKSNSANKNTPRHARDAAKRHRTRKASPANAKGLVWLIVAIVLLTALAAAVHFGSDRKLSPPVPAAASTRTAPAVPRTMAQAPSGARKATPPPAEPEPLPPVTDKEGRAAALITRANQLLKQDKTDQAAAFYREATQLTPGDEDAHYNLGIALARLGQTNEAVAEYKAALEIFPDYAEVHNNLGNLLLRAGKSDEALEHFQAAVKAMPDYAVAYNNLGNALRLAGRPGEALTNYAKAVEFNTNYWEARYNLGTGYKEQGRLEEAAAEYRAVLRLNPGFAPADQALKAVEKELPAPMR